MRQIVEKAYRKITQPFTKKVFRFANARKREVIHLFVLSPPLCGSTVLKQLIETSPHVTAFWCEGQWLPEAKELLGVRDRWNPELWVDWPKVKDVFHAYWSPLKRIRLEKSPAHIVRASQLEKAFDNSYFLITIRNPYAQIEGLLRRDWTSSSQAAAQSWVKAAKAQIRNIERLQRTCFFTYEELAEDSERIVQMILEFLPELGSISTNVLFTAHNVTRQPIHGLRNLNKEKIKNLSRSQIGEVTKVLSRNEDTLAHFGYTLIR